MIGKVIRFIGYTFCVVLVTTLYCFFSAGIGWLISDWLEQDPVWAQPDNWWEAHHIQIGIAAGIFLFIGLACMTYAAAWSFDNDNSDCPKSCPCPQHPWNQDHSNLVTAVEISAAAGVITSS